MAIVTLGIDLGKTVCGLAGLDEAETCLVPRRITKHSTWSREPVRLRCFPSTDAAFIRRFTVVGFRQPGSDCWHRGMFLLHNVRLGVGRGTGIHRIPG